MLTVVDVFDLKGRGTVVVLHELPVPLRLYVGAVLGRGDDRWTLVGVEHVRMTDGSVVRNHGVCVRGPATLHRGDVLTVVDPGQG